MGLRSATMACQRSTSAVSWISQQQGCSLFNYLDDFIGVSPPNTATTDFQVLGDLLTWLGLQESKEKSCSLSPVMICLGVQLDTNNLTLSVSSERLCEIDQLLEQWLTKRTATKSALQSLDRWQISVRFQDLSWWRRFLREYNGVSMINIAKWTSPYEVFSTDACLAGCGGVCDDQYSNGVFPPFISDQNLHISLWNF